MLVAGGSSRFTVHGDKGSVIKARADQQESQLLAGVVPGSAGWGQDDDPLVIYDASLQAHAQATPQGDQRQYYMLIRDSAEGPDRQSGAAGGSAGGDGRSGSGGALC